MTQSIASSNTRPPASFGLTTASRSESSPPTGSTSRPRSNAATSDSYRPDPSETMTEDFDTLNRKELNRTSRPSGVSDVFANYWQLPRPVLILCLGSLINRAGSFLMMFLTIYVSQQLGWGVPFATKCFGAFGAGAILAAIIGGQLADRIGRRPVMLFSLFAGAAILIAMGQTTHRWAFLGLVFSLSLCMDMFRPAASAMVGDLVTTERRPHAFALMYISFNLGFAVAAPIGGWLAGYSFQALFWGDAITTAAFGLIVLFALRETHPRLRSSVNAGTEANEAIHAERTTDNGQPTGQAATPAESLSAEATVPWSAAVKAIAKDTDFVLFSLATTLTSLVFMQAFTTLPIYLKQIGYSEQMIGWLLATNGIIIVFLQLPVTHWLSRFDRLAIILLGETLLGIGFGLTTLADSTVLFLVSISIWTLGEVVQASFKQSFVADLAPNALRARYMGVFSLCHAVGLTLGGPIGGEVFTRYGHQVLWTGCFAVVAVSASLYLVVMKRNQAKAAC